VAPDISSKTSLPSKRRRYTKSSSFIMALLFTLLCGLAAMSLGYFINYFAKGHFIDSTERVLDTELRYIEAVGEVNSGVQPSGPLYLILNKDGGLPKNIPPDLSRLSEGILVFTYPENKRRYAAKIYTLADYRKILIGTDITDISKDFKFMQILGIASIFFVMIVVFVAYVISIFVVSGTNKIADTAREIIDTGDLSRRLDVGSQWDDLSNMAAVLNILLDRVEELMHGVRQVSDNIAHDLRTPLTRMRNKIERLQKKYGHDDYADLMGESDQILNTFNALLRISRIEAEQKKSHFTDIDLKHLIRDVVAFYEPLAEDENIDLTSDLSEASYCGDRDLLFQAYANMLDNAVKFTPAGGRVSVKLYKEKGHIYVRITDTGAGIKEGEQNQIFNRFYRGEKSRNSAGTGLGLSLVRAVIDLHRGNVQVENSSDGLSIITIL